MKIWNSTPKGICRLGGAALLLLGWLPLSATAQVPVDERGNVIGTVEGSAQQTGNDAAVAAASRPSLASPGPQGQNGR